MKFKEHLSLDDFKEMYHLEAKFYEESHITPYKESYRWYLTFPWSNAALYDGVRLVGFLDLFPIREELYQRLAKGDYSDAQLKAEDIIDVFLTPNGKAYMYLCCIVIDEEYRKTDALKLLFQKQINFYKPFLEKGLEIEKIITDNVTREGDRFSTRFGLEKQVESTHGSIINSGDYRDFVKRIEEL